MQDDRLQHLLDARASELVSASLAIWSDGEVRSACLGPREDGDPAMVDAETRFQWGSVTKVVTAFILCQLVEEGKLRLDQPVVEILPDFGRAFPDAAKISVRHLLCHMGGLPDLFEPLETFDRLYARIADHGLLAEPGTLISYTNAGYGVLGAVIEALTGNSWEDAVRRRIIDPLGLKTVRFHAGLPEDEEGNVGSDHSVDPDGSIRAMPSWPRVGGKLAAAGATLMSGVEDAVRVVALLMLGHDPLDPQARPLLGKAMLDEMQSLQAEMPGPSYLAGGWGLGWSYNPLLNQVMHTGGSSIFAVGDRRTGTAGILMASTRNGSVVGRTLVADALGIGHSDYFPNPTKPSSFADVSGRYGSFPIMFDIRQTDDGVLAQLSLPEGMDPVDAFQLTPLGEASYTGDLMGVTSEMTFMGDGPRPRLMHAGLRALVRVDS